MPLVRARFKSWRLRLECPLGDCSDKRPLGDKHVASGIPWSSLPPPCRRSWLPLRSCEMDPRALTVCKPPASSVEAHTGLESLSSPLEQRGSGREAALNGDGPVERGFRPRGRLGPRSDILRCMDPKFTGRTDVWDGELL